MRQMHSKFGSSQHLRNLWNKCNELQNITMLVNVIGHSPLPKNCATCKDKKGVVCGKCMWMHGYISGAKNGV